MTAIAPRAPIGKGWRRLGDVPTPLGSMAAWQLDAICCLSGVESPDGRPEYHVSVSALASVRVPVVVYTPDRRRSPTDQEMEEVRTAFPMGRASEDNHGDGVRCHLWIDVGATSQDPCPRKANEHSVRVGDRLQQLNEAAGGRS